MFAGDYLVGENPSDNPPWIALQEFSKETSKCQPPQNGEQVCSVPLAFENPSQLDNPKIKILSNTPPKRVTITKGDQISSPTGTRNVGATITTFDTSFPANSKEDSSPRFLRKAKDTTRLHE